MRKFLLPFVLASVIGAAAYAADQPAAEKPAAEKPAATPAATPAPAASLQAITAELNDGSKIEMDADGSVWVLGAGNSKTEAPDGLLTLRDGTPFVVKDGKRTSDDSQQ